MEGPPAKRRHIGFDYESESGLQLIARLGRQPPLENLLPELFQPHLEAKEVVEVVGESGTGKSQLMFHMIVSCILPSTWNGISFHGLDVGVIFVDNNCQFNIGCLATSLHDRITSSISAVCGMKIEDNEIEEFMKKCLKKLLVLQCFSSDQFRITLYSLNALFMDNLDAKVLVIDGISSFYWWDRMMNGSNPTLLDNLHQKITFTLKKLVTDCQLTLFATKHILMNTKKTESELNTAGTSQEYDIMGRDWSSFVTRKILLQKDKSKPPTFSAGCYMRNVCTTQGQFVIKQSGIEFVNHRVL